MKTHRFLFYLLLVLLPTQLTKYFFPNFAFVAGIRVDYLAPVIYLTDIIVVGIVLTATHDLLKKTRLLFSRETTIIITVCFVGIILTTVFAISPLVALLKWFRIIEALFISFYIANEKLSLKTSSLLLVIGGIYSCILAWMQFVHQSSIGGIVWWIGERTFAIATPGIARITIHHKLFLRPYGTFPHPNVLAGFLTCLIPFIFYLKNFNKYTQLFFFPTLILFLATILITFSQTAWIVAIVTTIVFALQHQTIKFTKPLLFLGILTVSITTFISYQFVEPESISRRVTLAENAFVIVREHPLFGVGLNNFILANQQQSINSYQDLQPVHSIYLLFIAETGIVGVFLAILFFRLFYKKIRINSLSFFFVWSLSTLYVFGLFDHYPLTIHQTLLLSGILTGFIYSTSRSVIHLKKGELYGKRSK